LEKALKIGEELNDLIILVLTNMWLGIFHLNNCEFDSSLDHYKKALEINVAANSIWGVSAIESNITWLYVNQ
jgi:hypothetical protein